MNAALSSLARPIISSCRFAETRATRHGRMGLPDVCHQLQAVGFRHIEVDQGDIDRPAGMAAMGIGSIGRVD